MTRKHSHFTVLSFTHELQSVETGDSQSL